MRTVTFVTKADCDHCAEVRETLAAVAARYPGTVIKDVDAASPAGRELVIKHGIMASPGILVDGALVGMGNVSEADLAAALKPQEPPQA